VLRERGRRHRAAHRAPAPGPVTAPLPAHLPPVQTAARDAAPAHPALPAVPLIIAIALLGAGAFVSSYMKTGARIRRTEAERIATETIRRRQASSTPRQEARS
jgi:hypothetical protein